MKKNVLNKNLKLLVLTASFPYGNGEGFLKEEIRALSLQDCDITIVPLWPRGIFRQDFIAETACESPALVSCKVKPLFGFGIFVVGLCEFFASPVRVAAWIFRLLISGSLRVRLKNLVVIPKALWLAHQLRILGIDHLHVHWASTTATCGMVAADIAGVDWSFTCHRWDIYENNLLYEKSRSASFVRFISRRGMNDGCALGISEVKAVLVRMGVRLPGIRSQGEVKNGSRFHIICAANLIPVKGHKYLLDAVSLLVARGLDIQLSLAGDGPLRQNLMVQVEQCGLIDRVNFLGHIDHMQLLEMYRLSKFDAFVLPSVDLGNGEHEGVPVSLMEAIAHGLPVLSTKTGSISELLPDALGATVPDKDPHALAAVLVLLATNDGYRKEFSDAQRKIVQAWNSQRTAQELALKFRVAMQSKSEK